VTGCRISDLTSSGEYKTILQLVGVLSNGRTAKRCAHNNFRFVRAEFDDGSFLSRLTDAAMDAMQVRSHASGPPACPIALRHADLGCAANLSRTCKICAKRFTSKCCSSPGQPGMSVALLTWWGSYKLKADATAPGTAKHKTITAVGINYLYVSRQCIGVMGQVLTCFAGIGASRGVAVLRHERLIV